MSRIYGRQYDLESLCSKLTKEKFSFYCPDTDRTTWNEVMESPKCLDVYLTPKAIDLCESKHFFVYRNVFRNSTATFFPNDKTDPIILFPTYGAREDYKAQFVKFLGEVIANDSKYVNEYQQLIPLMFEYFYFTMNSNDPDREFELRNLYRNIRPAKSFLNDYKLHHKIPNFYGTKEFEADILKCLQGISSFEASLQLIELLKTNPDKACQILDDVIFQRGETYDILADNDIYSYGYKSLRKVIDNRKK